MVICFNAHISKLIKSNHFNQILLKSNSSNCHQLNRNFHISSRFFTKSEENCDEGIYRSEFPPIQAQDRSFPETLVDLIRSHSQQQPERPAFINIEDADDKLTYAELLQNVNSTANFYHSIGFSQGDVAAVLLPNCWQYFVAFIASGLVGGSISGINPHSVEDEIRRAFSQIRCKLVFCTEPMLQTMLKMANEFPHIKAIVLISSNCRSNMTQNLPHNVIHFSELLASYSSPGSLNCPSPKIDVEKNILLLPFSSGTTGPPKAVMLTHKNIGTMARIFVSHMDNYILRKMDPNLDYRRESFQVLIPLFHIFGFVSALNILLTGSSGILYKRFDMELFCKGIQEYKIRQITVVPPILIQMASSSLLLKYDLSSLQFILSGAAPISPDICEAIKKRIPSVKQIAQGYGLTEASMASHAPVYGMDSVGSIGRLLPNFEMKFVDIETGLPVSLGEKGELCLRGPTIMRGYLNHSDATSEAIDEEGWLKTGDIGYQDHQGLTYIVGRRKELIKVKGLQVSPVELEDVLLSYKAIRDCAVIGVPNPNADDTETERPRAYIVKADPKITEWDVKRYIRGKVSGYKRLSGGIEFVTEIPRNQSGKILRRVLKEQYLSQTNSNKNVSECDNAYIYGRIRRMKRKERKVKNERST